MKILYFTQLFYPFLFGGGERIFYQWATELVKRGHDVYVITQNIEGLQSQEIVDGIRVFRVGAAMKKSKTPLTSNMQNLSYMIKAFFMGLHILREQKIDLIHSNTYVPVFVAQFCSILSHIPHIVTIHDVYYLNKNFWKNWSGQGQSQLSYSRIGSFIEKIILKTNCTIFHTVSEESKQDMELAGTSKKIIMIPNGINTNLYEKTLIEKNQAVFIGRLVFYKNVETIIRSFQYVIKKIPDAKLMIIGEGPVKQNLQDIVTKLGLDQNIEFTGVVSDEEKVKILCESRVLLNPSLIEGFGMVILEAFACKKPVIISDIKPLSDLVLNSNDGYTINAKNTSEWSEKIIEILSNKELAQKMGLNGYQKITHKYSMEKIIEELTKLYRSVIN